MGQMLGKNRKRFNPDFLKENCPRVQMQEKEEVLKRRKFFDTIVHKEMLSFQKMMNQM